MRPPALLALEDGSLFHGVAIGATGVASGEVVFNTAMTGYQEILTDPSYCRQMVTLTYPHIGNVGVNENDRESASVQAAGLILREVPRAASNWRSEQNLDAYLADNNVVAIGDIDTRRLTRLLREKGAQNGCIMAGEADPDAAIRAACDFPGLKGMDLAAEAGVAEPYEWQTPGWGNEAPAARFRIAVYDYGVKYNILRWLVDQGCAVTVVPPRMPLDDVLAMGVDGVVLSNGPGDPDVCDYAISTAQELLKRRVPTLGICLGHQFLSLAAGANSVKLKFGHHGANHPVMDLATGGVLISSQNHSFGVDEASLPAGVTACYRSLFDDSLQGIEFADAPAFTFQGHPEASPGPDDVAPLFTRFTALMRTAKDAKSAK